MKREKWPVTEGHQCPAGNPGRCCYCDVPVGDEHEPDCVCRQRTVVVEVTARFVRLVPEDWDAATIEFQMNESSSCANNLVDDLAEILDNKDEGERACFCGQVEGRYVREATAEDEEADGVFVEADPDSPFVPAGLGTMGGDGASHDDGTSA